MVQGKERGLDSKVVKISITQLELFISIGVH